MDFEDITLGEIEEIEEYAGLPIAEIADTSKVGTQKLRTALAWIIKRRVDANFTIDDAKKLKASELFELMNSLGDSEKKA